MLKKINKLYFMSRRFLKDIRKPLVFDLQEPSRMHLPKLEEYYLLFKEKDMQKQKGGQKSFEFDQKGIPVVPTYVDVESKGFNYYPITIGQYGLSIFHTYLVTRNKEDLKRFLNIADWFMDNKNHSKELGTYWLTHTLKPEYRVSQPWKSAFSQSRAISILLRAYQETEKQEYLDTAIDSIHIYDVDNSNGGVKARYGEYIIYEEYTAKFNVGVLDGAFFSLYGLYDLYRLQPELAQVKKLIDDGIKGLVNLLPHYDLDYWIKYSLTEADFYPNPDPATRGYFYLILSQLKVFSYLSKNDTFDLYFSKFKRYDKFVNIIKMYREKYNALKKLNRI